MNKRIVWMAWALPSMCIGCGGSSKSDGGLVSTPDQVGCVTLVHSTNFPATGVTCNATPDAGISPGEVAGEGGADGGAPFAFGSAYEAVIDSNCLTPLPTRTVAIVLRAAPAVCDLPTTGADAGGPSLEIDWVIVDGGDPAPGVFEIATEVVSVSSATLRDDAVGVGPRPALRGQLEVTSVGECGLAGTFEMQFGLLPDGGGEEPLTGSFGAAYCVTQEAL